MHKSNNGRNRENIIQKEEINPIELEYLEINPIEYDTQDTSNQNL